MEKDKIFKGIPDKYIGRVIKLAVAESIEQNLTGPRGWTLSNRSPQGQSWTFLPDYNHPDGKPARNGQRKVREIVQTSGIRRRLREADIISVEILSKWDNERHELCSYGAYDSKEYTNSVDQEEVLEQCGDTLIGEMIIIEIDAVIARLRPQVLRRREGIRAGNIRHNENIRKWRESSGWK